MPIAWIDDKARQGKKRQGCHELDAYWANQGQCAGWSAKSRMTNESAVKILMRTPPEIRGTSLQLAAQPLPR